MAQALATFTATMPATFATFPETLAERHARRSSHRRTPNTETAPPEQGTAADKAPGAQGRRQAGSASGKPQRRGQRHATGPQTRGTERAELRRYIGIAQNIKTPYRCAKTANRAYIRKAAGIHQRQRKTPHSVSHAGQGCYFWSFARSSSSSTGCNRIYNKINGGTSFPNNLRRCGYPLRRWPAVGI